MKETIFISGIDTDAGKTYATGWLARELMKQGVSVATQKFIQTGCTSSSEDIEMHRKIMGCGMLPEDKTHFTAPIIFTYPASAQLAAKMDGREIDLSIIDAARQELEKRYDVVLVEGAGGLMVPITDDFMAIDYVATRKLTIALVTNANLGSINHTVLSLESIERRGLPLKYVIFNHHFDSDAYISADTRAWIERYVKRHHPDTKIIDVPSFKA